MQLQTCYCRVATAQSIVHAAAHLLTCVTQHTQHTHSMRSIHSMDSHAFLSCLFTKVLGPYRRSMSADSCFCKSMHLECQISITRRGVQAECQLQVEPSQEAQMQKQPPTRALRTFKLFLRTYIYVVAEESFHPLPGMPRHLPQQICQALKALHQIETSGKPVYGCHFRRTSSLQKCKSVGSKCSEVLFLSFL